MCRVVDVCNVVGVSIAVHSDHSVRGALQNTHEITCSPASSLEGLHDRKSCHRVVTKIRLTMTREIKAYTKALQDKWMSNNTRGPVILEFRSPPPSLPRSFLKRSQIYTIDLVSYINHVRCQLDASAHLTDLSQYAKYSWAVHTVIAMMMRKYIP